jgi:NAD(P)-dependent dehydrogenase (short-subunit alcohol dehydrogenase family)
MTTPDRRAAIVTGSSRGLGLAIATALLHSGWAITLHGRDEQRLAATSRRLGEDAPFGVGSTTAFAADLRSKSSCRRLVTHHMNEFGRLDALVVNAAMASPAWIAQLEDEAIDEQIEMNLSSAFALVGGALVHLENAPAGGRVILVSSITAKIPIKTLSVYSATKAALRSFSRSINLECGRRNVRSTAIIPGYIDTDLASGGVVAEAEQMMSADDVAEVTRFLLEAPASVVIGECSITRAVAPLFET